MDSPGNNGVVQTPAHGGDAERRGVTILFADMADYTATVERIGEEGAYDLMRPIYGLMAKIVRREGGVVKDFTGDGIMAVFGAPVALEDATLRACRAALGIQAEVAGLAADFHGRLGVRPRLRVGVNAGPVISGQMESGLATFSGDTVNFASRLQGLAEPGEVLVGEAAHRMVEGLVESRYLGLRSVKGISEPRKIYRLEAVKPGAGRFVASLHRGVTAYVGRDAAIAALAGALADSRRSLRVVDIVGEPGMGKSRLLYEFPRRLPLADFWFAKGSCVPDGARTPFHLFIDLTRKTLRLGDNASSNEMDAKISAALDTLQLNSRENAGLLRNLLGATVVDNSLEGLDGTLVGLRTRELLLAMLRARCRLAPNIVVLEDLHWIDSASAEVLKAFIECSADLPLFIAHARRPEYRPPWLSNPAVTTLELEPLSPDDVGKIVQERLGLDALPAALAGRIVEKADGNALFAEEIANYLVERGSVRRDGSGIAFDALAAAVPPSVGALLAARADELDRGDRALLQAASVLGRRFDTQSLAEVAGDNRDLNVRLEAMAAQNFVFFDARGEVWTFKHALLRDALYDSLLTARRAELHLKAAEEIERRNGNRLPEFAEMLAGHYLQTGRRDKAFFYLSMAGRKSLSVYSLTEAANHLGAAAELLDRAPDELDPNDVAEFLPSHIQRMQLSFEPRQIVDASAKYRALIEKMGDRVEAVVALHYEVWGLIWMARFVEARGQQKIASEMAERLGDGKSRAYSEAGVFFLDSIPCERADDIVARGDRAIEIASLSGDVYIAGWLRFMVAWNAFHRGKILRAKAIVDDLLRAGAELRDPRSTGLALWLRCWMSIVSDDPETALRCAEEAEKSAILPLERSTSESGKAAALVALRRVEEGAPLLAAVRARAARHERWFLFMGNDFAYGVALALRGDIAAGVRHIEKAIVARDAQGFTLAADWYRMGLGRMYIEILDGGGPRAPLKVVLRNLGFLVHAKAFGRRKAIRLLDRAARHPSLNDENFHRGNIRYLLGLAYLGRGDKRAAATHLRSARGIVERHGASVVLDKIDAALTRAEA